MIPKSKGLILSRNFISIFLGQGLSLLINLAAFTLIARYLEVADFGKFNYWLAWIGIMAKAFDLGFNPIIFREYTTHKDEEIIRIVFTFRLIVLAVFAIGVNIFLSAIDFSGTHLILVNLLMVNIIFSHKYNNFRDLLHIPYKVNFKMHIAYSIIFFDNLLFLFGVILMPYLGAQKLTYLVSIYLLVNIPGFLLVFKFNEISFYRVLKINFPKLKELFNESKPIAGFVVVSVIFLQLDILMVEYLMGTEEVGIYSTAVRLTRPLIIIPSALMMVIFPLIVSGINLNKSIKEHTYLTVKLLLFGAVSFGLLVSFNSERLITVIFGNKYLAAHSSLTLLGWSLTFAFLNFFFLELLTANKKQKFNFFYALLILFTNFVLNLILIPYLGISGAALAKIIAYLAGSIFLVYIFKKYEIYIDFPVQKILLFAVISGVIIYFIAGTSLYIYIPAAIITFIASAAVIKYFNINEIRAIINNMENVNE